MSCYLKYLFEVKEKAKPIRFRIIFEGYNPEAVKANANKFMDYAEADGFNIPEETMKVADQEKKGLFSVYFDCIRDNDEWRIRCSDHQHNNNYDNDTNFQIVADYELSDEEIESKYNKFIKNVDLDLRDKDKVIDTLLHTDFAQKFVIRYQSKPGWMNKLLQEYGINPSFKQMLQQRCEYFANQSIRFNQMYRKTNISTWKKGKPLEYY